MKDDFLESNLPGQTPLDQLESEGLIAHVHNKSEIDEAEARVDPQHQLFAQP